MPDWTLWLIPSVFALVFAYFVASEVLGTRPPRTADHPCPSAHRDAVPVQDVGGGLVAWLCVDPDCGKQLPQDWGTRRSRDSGHAES